MLELDSSFASSFQPELLTVTDLSRSIINSLETKEFLRSHLLTPKTITFVDSQISDAMTVMAGLQTDIKILLDPAQDGITRITEEDKPLWFRPALSTLDDENWVKELTHFTRSFILVILKRNN